MKISSKGSFPSCSKLPCLSKEPQSSLELCWPLLPSGPFHSSCYLRAPLSLESVMPLKNSGLRTHGATSQQRWGSTLQLPVGLVKIWNNVRKSQFREGRNWQWILGTTDLKIQWKDHSQGLTHGPPSWAVGLFLSDQSPLLLFLPKAS